jgi:hypothetical protein
VGAAAAGSPRPPPAPAVTSPYPTWVGAGAAAGQSFPPQWQYVAAIQNGPVAAAAYGGPATPQDQVIHRCYITGPPASTCQLFIGDQPPAQLVTQPRYIVDSTPAGAADYGAWSPPLPLPAGFFAVWYWSGGLTDFGTYPAAVHLLEQGTS